MKLFFLTLLFITFCNWSMCQESSIEGVVVDNITNVNIANANISFYAGDKLILKVESEASGIFKAPISVFNLFTQIKISCLNYKPLIYNRGSKLKEDFGVFKLESYGIRLDDVVIKKPSRYRDTMNIELSDKKFEREIMIDDLFSKEMGFYKNSNGQLFYKGKIVSDVVVNGGDFFGKNNMEIYKNLPALILNDIQIVETDIDSLTNTTLQNPAIKVNLKLKEKYKKGSFGNASLGLGTLKRYILSTDLYSYKKSEQLSLMLNSNNINVSDGAFEPRINFVSNGNNSINHSSKLSYRNLYYKKKVELSIDLRGKINQATIASESERLDEATNQFSKTSNRSKTKTYAFERASVNINYRIDSLNFLQFNQVIDYNRIKLTDSLGYLINIGNVLNQFEVNKQRNSISKSFDSKMAYKKLFSSKKGRSLNFITSYKDQKNNVMENNMVYNYFNFFNSSYFVNGERQVKEKKIDVATEYTEPLNETAYITALGEFKQERFLFNEDIKSDSIGNSIRTGSLNYKYLTSGIKLYEKINRITLEGAFSTTVNKRDLGENMSKIIWNTEAKINLEYKYGKKKSLNTSYTKTVNYPQSSQLVGVNNSFDIIAQQQGNLKLLPEIKNKIEFIYDLKKTDSINVSLNGNVELFASKFGFAISTVPKATQVMSIDNVGSALNAYLTLNISKNLAAGHNFNYRMGLNFQELPGIINQEKQLNRSLSINQAITTNLTVLKNVLSNSPSLSIALSRLSYEGSKDNQFNVVYTDRVVLNFLKFQFNTYPFLNFNYSLTKTFTFALNAEIKKTFHKNYGSVWLKAYDVFNSFKYVNNLNTSSYIENIKYSNINRYFLLGISLKLNNMR